MCTHRREYIWPHNNGSLVAGRAYRCVVYHSVSARLVTHAQDGQIDVLRLSGRADLIGKCPEMKSWDSSGAFRGLVRQVQRAASAQQGAS